MAYKQKSSDFSKLFAVWTGLELYIKKAHFSRLSVGHRIAHLLTNFNHFNIKIDGF
jgi:hypothetical protein